MSANPFVKTELQRSEIEPMPAKNYFSVVYPCSSCGPIGPKRWEYCMRQRRHCLRRNEEHPLPTIERVPIDQLDDTRDYACVFETNGSDTIAWDKRTTRCRVPCDKCWSLGQCTRNHHCLDPSVIAFLDIDDAPGVTPAKRSCKNSSSSPSGSAKAPGSGGRDAKQARKSPAASPAARPGPAGGGFSSSASPPVTPSPAPRLPARPATAAAAATGPAASTQRSSPSTGGSSNSGGGGGGGSGSSGSSSSSSSSFPSDSAAGAAAAAGYVGKGKGRQQAAGAGVGSGGSGSAPRSRSPDTGAGTGSGADASAGAGDQRSASGGGSEIYVESLRGRVQSATVKVQKVAEYLTELDKVKQHERAKIRDAERLIKHTETKEQEHQQVLVNAQAEETTAKNKLRDALKRRADRLKEDAARLEREAQQLLQ